MRHHWLHIWVAIPYNIIYLCWVCSNWFFVGMMHNLYVPSRNPGQRWHRSSCIYPNARIPHAPYEINNAQEGPEFWISISTNYMWMGGNLMDSWWSDTFIIILWKTLWISYLSGWNWCIPWHPLFPRVWVIEKERWSHIASCMNKYTYRLFGGNRKFWAREYCVRLSSLHILMILYMLANGHISHDSSHGHRTYISFEHNFRAPPRENL